MPDPNEEVQRLSHYVSWKVLDEAEAQAQRHGFENVQEYCTALLIKAIETERLREHVKDVEARHGTLDGLREIADDPEFLAELSAANLNHGDRPGSPPISSGSRRKDPSEIQFLEPDVTLPGAGLFGLSEPWVVDSTPPEHVHPHDPRPRPGQSQSSAPFSLENLRPEPPPPSMSLAAQVVLRHAGQLGDDPYGFLACLRRGQSVPPAEVAELAQALNQIEREYVGVKTMERGLTFALYRLAFESQILHTDAWPGTFDVWTVDMLRAVQEAVERILSGQDIRYYPGTRGTNPEPDPRPERPR